MRDSDSFTDQPRPFLVFDRGYWKEDRFHELERKEWGWSIPWKKRTLIGVQLEILEFPTSKKEPLEVLVWALDNEQPWRRIIGIPDPTTRKIWDILTGDLELNPLTILQLQTERWKIKTLFQRVKQNTTIKHPLGTTWVSFVTHCLLVALLQIILAYYLLLLGFPRWQDHLPVLLENLRYSNMEPWLDHYLIGEKIS